MSKKATLSNMNKQLTEPEEVKKEPKKPVAKKEDKPKAVKKTKAPKKETHIPRGERGDFLKTSITISAQLLTDIRALGMERKAKKQKDTDFSALVREALIDLLNKPRKY